MNNTKETAPAKSNGKALPETDGEAWAKVEAAAARAKMKQEAKTPAKTKIKSPKKAPTIAGEDVNAEQKPPVAAKKGIAAEVKEAPANPTSQSKRARTVRVKAEPPVATIEQAVLTETQAAPPIALEDTPAPAAEVETEPVPMVEIEHESAPEAEKEISIDATAAVAHATPEQRPAQAARVEIEGEARIAVENAGDPVHHGEAQIEPEGGAALFATDFEAIAAEAISYSQKSFENGSALVEKLLAAKSLESAIQIGSDYVQKSCTELVEYLTRIAALYAKLATGAFQPRSPIRLTND